MDGIDNPLWAGRLSAFLTERQIETLMRGLHAEASVSVRLNPFKPGAVFDGATPVPWNPYARMLRERPSFTLDPLFHAGAYYVQDSSAMFVGHVFRTLLPDNPGGVFKVLDLCASPGGKTTDLASSLRLAYGDEFSLTANEVMRRRVPVLKDNVVRWGDPAVKVTSLDPKVFGRAEDAYDVIVADVPCSGEGMFRKDAKAVEDWSPELVEVCAARQRRIVADVWPALKDGGILLYSTCTFEEQENDGNVRWICDTLGGMPLTDGKEPPFDGIVKTALGYLLLPGAVPGEGQYVAALRKRGYPGGGQAEPTDGRAQGNQPRPRGAGKHSRGGRRRTQGDGADARRGESPRREGMSPDPDKVLRIDFDKNDYPCIEIDRRTALEFLHGDTFVLKDAPTGHLVMCYGGLPIGMVKNLGHRCNNLCPARRRILMDIKDK